MDKTLCHFLEWGDERQQQEERPNIRVVNVPTNNFEWLEWIFHQFSLYHCFDKQRNNVKKNEKEDLGYIIKISDLPFSLYLVKVGVGFQFYKPKLA